MEPILATDLEDDDERAAFRRMLLQNAPATPRPSQGRISSKPVSDPKLQSAYTHGLEMVYALESVDPDSIRPISTIQETAVGYDSPLTSKEMLESSEQLEFDFGPGFRTWMEPLVLLEPIGVLGLPAQAEKLLLEARRAVIADLLDYDLRSLGLGQGHIDDIRSKLSAHLLGKDLKRCNEWDLEAFIRTLFLFCDVRAGYTLFQDYHLQGVCRLSLATAAEVRRAGPEQQRRWRVEAMATWQMPQSRSFFYQKIEEAIAAFVRPWMLRRQGIASRADVLERLQRVTSQEALVQPFLSWANDVFADGNSVLDGLLLQPVEGLFCADEATSHLVTNVLQCIRSYFYNSGVVYPLSQLCHLVQRELACYWISPDSTQVTKIIELCSWLRMRKGPNGVRFVSLS